MSILHSRETQVVIDRVIAESVNLPNGTPKGFAEFVRHYYRSVSYDDLKERDIADLLGSAHAHWQLGKQREESESNIRIYNPDAERHGWQSNYTIIEIVSEDRPFLVDSIAMLLNKLGLTIHLTVHPIFCVERNKDGALTKMNPATSETRDSAAESYLHVEFDRRFGSDSFEQIKRQLDSVLADIKVANEHWASMRAKVLEAADEIEREMKRQGIEDHEDRIEFCRWLEDGNFTFLGYCELNQASKSKLNLDEDSLLGILNCKEQIDTILPSKGLGSEPREQSLLITKANTRSPIHRPSYMDLVTVAKYDRHGQVAGIRVILGLFASTAYNRSVRAIPLLRRKFQQVISRSGLPDNSYDGRVLANIVDNYPRDNLFRISADELFEDVAGIMELQERQRVRVFKRDDPYGRFCSVLVYLPRERYSRDLRIKIQDILLDSLNATSSQFDATFTESVLARINYTIHRVPGTKQKHTDEQILESVTAATRNWSDLIGQAALQRFGEKRRIALMDKYLDAFPHAYQDDFSARTAAADMERMEKLSKACPIRVFFYRPLVESEGAIRLKIYNLNDPISPSDSLPVVENMGLRVESTRPYKIKCASGPVVWIHDYAMAHSDGLDIDPDAQRERFEDAFLRIWNADVENDGFNQLILSAELNWREVSMLRAYSRYLKQIGIQYSESYMIETLTLHPHMTKRLVNLFEMLFSPELVDSAEKFTDQVNFVLSRLEVVKSLDEDVILRSFMNAIMSTLRTNYYRNDEHGEPLPYMSFKIDSARITRMPDPRPMFEIFVYSPRVEAIHLRGGKVARGGLRWSDRREDYRTEVLGLVKAQLVKNAVIVPVGSKGGFVVKQLPAAREETQREVEQCYKTFIRGMLDITDNLKGGEIVPPQDVRAYDAGDPYLVVAADKGTATFSDIANSVSEEYGFWLGDAFASGGSAGYDHKGMGITARGAWESVKRHFRELGTDIQAADFTVVGVGDMGGDVFGNGMLLSRHIKLVGAFNHLHIFIDPAPDPAASFTERKRLFELPRSTWKDYNEKLISKGGGIYERSAKSISLSPEAQSALGIEQSDLTPSELIHEMLMAPVDLLWNGGIGTYVKASSETHDDAADRANDSVRVNGKDLRCRVVGEGGNLGLTQRGRIEYSLNGGRCFTDFIDNAGGVDCSDHEVNIKILLNEVVSEGDMTVKQRNRCLEQMTETVGDHVLADNYDQTQAISIAHTRALELVGEHRRYIRELERAGELNRQLEFLPDNETLRERALNGQGLTMPELSVLLSYSKLTLYQKLLNSDFPEGKYLGREIVGYFPSVLAEQYQPVMFKHRLKREIIATTATNSMVNRVGPTFAFRLSQLTGAEYPDIARAYTAVREIFAMHKVWEAVEALDNVVDAKIQTQMLLYASGLIERASMWVLRHCELPLDIDKVVNLFQAGVEQVAGSLPKSLPSADADPMREQVRHLVESKVPKSLAKIVAGFFPLSTALDIVEISNQTGKPVLFVAEAYFEVGACLDLRWIRDQVADLPAENLWHQLAKSRLRDDVHGHQYAIVLDIVRNSSRKKARETVAEWIKGKGLGYRRLENLIDELKATGSNDFATLSVAISEVHALRRGAIGGVDSG